MKVQYKFDPYKLVGISKKEIPEDKQDDVLNEIKSFVLDRVLQNVGEGKSPVTGRAFKKLSKNYADFKQKEGATVMPNLELNGEMLDSLEVVIENGKLILKVSEDQADKADNHNKFSAASKKTAVPARKFIPNANEDETFTKDILNGIKGIIEDGKEESE